MPTNEYDWFKKTLKRGQIEIWHGGQIAIYSLDRKSVRLLPIGR